MPEVVPVGTDIRDFLGRFSMEARDALREVKPNGMLGVVRETLPEFGRVGIFLAEASYGADHGRYVVFVMLYEFCTETGEKLLLEDALEGWLWSGRHLIL